MKFFLAQIFKKKIGWLVISLLLTGLFVVLSDFYDWAELGIYICLIYPVVLLIILIIHAWILNPIRERKENKKLQNGSK